MSFTGALEPLALEVVKASTELHLAVYRLAPDGKWTRDCRTCGPTDCVSSGDEAALTIACIAVGVVGGICGTRWSDRYSRQLHDPLVGNVGEQQIAVLGEIDRPSTERIPEATCSDGGFSNGSSARKPDPGTFPHRRSARISDVRRCDHRDAGVHRELRHTWAAAALGRGKQCPSC